MCESAPPLWTVIHEELDAAKSDAESARKLPTRVVIHPSPTVGILPGTRVQLQDALGSLAVGTVANHDAFGLIRFVVDNQPGDVLQQRPNRRLAEFSSLSLCLCMIQPALRRSPLAS